jgi:signal transduction histidine kinase
LQGLLLTYSGGTVIPIGQEALREAMALRRPVVISDLSQTLPDEGKTVSTAGRSSTAGAWARIYRALLAVPIVVQNEIYGGMLLYYGRPRTFSDEEVDLAILFADQVALAIENAWLREQVRVAAASAERDRLARDLHDAVTQTLFSASLIAEAMPRVWEQDPDQGRRGLEELRRLTRGAAAEMRALLLELRPAALTEKPLGELLRHLAEAMTSRTRLPIALSVDGDASLREDVQVALYRIAQESLNNVAKHARANRVAVDLSVAPGRALLRIRDDGTGFDPGDILPDQFGVSIMRERAAEVSAVLEIDSRAGGGTEVVVHWQDGGGGR